MIIILEIRRYIEKDRLIRLSNESSNRYIISILDYPDTHDWLDVLQKHISSEREETRKLKKLMMIMKHEKLRNDGLR